MKKITLMLLVIQSGIMMAQTKTVLTPNGQKITIPTNANNGITGSNGFTQLGGDLNKPTAIATTATNTLAISGLATSTNPSDTPLVRGADGILKKGAFPPINIIPTDIGTVITINGKLEVAQEITVMLTADYPIGSAAGTNQVIGKIRTILIDNKRTFSTSDTSNSFTVTTDGPYLISINAQFYNTNAATGVSPAIGVWCNTDNTWVARTSAVLAEKNMNLTLLTSITMSASKTYSFRASSDNTTAMVKANNTGIAGSGGPITYFSLKRL